MAHKSSIGPITLQPRLVERIWGAARINDWYPQPTEGKRIGEVWLTAEECAVAGSTETLKDLASRAPAALDNERGEGFPLLIKLLYPHEKLSVQVHPNDDQALSTLGQPRGKTECWYVLSADPGAQVAVGFNEPMEASGIRAAISDGTAGNQASLHRGQGRRYGVSSTQAPFTQSGRAWWCLRRSNTAEVTYRLWDYGRPRELHLDAGLAVARATTAAGLVPAKDMPLFKRLIECSYFTVG